METPPHGDDFLETPLNEDGRLVDIDRVARDGLYKEGDSPGADLFDQEGDLTNITGSAALHDEERGPKNRVHNAAGMHSRGIGVAGLSVVESLEEEEEDDPAAQWLRDNDPGLKK